MHALIFVIVASEVKPLSSGWCESEVLVRGGCAIVFGMLRLCNTLPYVSGFEKRDHFALYMKYHYRQKHANKSCFQESRITASYVPVV